MKKEILIILLSLCFCECFSQNADSIFRDMWFNYSLTIDSVPIRMSLYFFDNYDVKGNYYENCQKKITLDGHIKNGIISLSGFYLNKIIGILIINTRVHEAAYPGIWYDSLKQTKTNLKVTTENGTGGTFDRKYAFGIYGTPDGTDEEVEDFAEAIKIAIIAGDKKWIAQHVSFPFEIGSYNKRESYEDEKSFLSNYDKIITADYIGYTKSLCPHNLFWNASGVLFGNFWIGFPVGGADLAILRMD